MRRDFVRSHLHRSRSSASSLSGKAADKSSPGRPGHRPIETRLAVTTQPEARAPDQGHGPGAISCAVPDGDGGYSRTTLDSMSSSPTKVVVHRPMIGDGRGNTRGDMSVCNSSTDDASEGGSSSTYHTASEGSSSTYSTRREFVRRCAALKYSLRPEECAPDRAAVKLISSSPATAVVQKSTIEDDSNNSINTSICKSDTDDASECLSPTNSCAEVDLISSSPNTVRMLKTQ